MGWLSVAENQKYQLLSESNRVQLIPVPPRRGWIIDRNGKPIAINRSSFRVDIIPQQLVDGPKVVARVAEVLQLPSDEVERITRELQGFARVPAGLGRRQYQLRAICGDHGSPARTSRASRASRGFARFYPGGSTVGQLVGYVGAASAKRI